MDSAARTSADVVGQNLASDELATRLADVRARIAAAAERTGRPAAAITLVGACKTVPAAVVHQAAAMGLTDFGDNYVQEAAARRSELGGWPTGVRWHLIGHLQSNKVRAALELFNVIQTVDSVRLAEQISRRAGDRRVVVLLEVVLGDAPERIGFRPDELGAALSNLCLLPGLSIEGLMTVPPLGLSQTETRAAFRRLRELRAELRARYPELALPHLSMGMTEDFELAIEEGATIVRVGRAIFGERPSRQVH